MLEDSLRAHFAHVAASVDSTVEQRLLDYALAIPRRSTGRSASSGRGRRWAAPALSVIGVVAVVAVVAATAFTVGRRTAPSTGSSEVAVHSGATTSSAASSGAKTLITPQFIIRTTMGLLPTQGLKDQFDGSSEPGLVAGSLRYTSGASSSDLLVEIAYPSAQASAANPTACSSRDLLSPHSQRTIRKDGSTMVVIPKAKYWLELYLCLPDGVTVSAIERTAKGGGAVTLTASDLAAVVTSNSWQRKVPLDKVKAAARMIHLHPVGGDSSPSH